MSEKEILDKLFKISEEEYEPSGHAYSDSSTRWDDLCDEESWYHYHFEEICTLLKELKQMRGNNA